MKPYKQLRKKLKNKYCNPFTVDTGYNGIGAIIAWVSQSGITCKAKHVQILVRINDGKLFYPYQKADRKKILKYLKENEKL